MKFWLEWLASLLIRLARRFESWAAELHPKPEGAISPTQSDIPPAHWLALVRRSTAPPAHWIHYLHTHAPPDAIYIDWSHQTTAAPSPPPLLKAKARIHSTPPLPPRRSSDLTTTAAPDLSVKSRLPTLPPSAKPQLLQPTMPVHIPPQPAVRTRLRLYPVVRPPQSQKLESPSPASPGPTPVTITEAATQPGFHKNPSPVKKRGLEIKPPISPLLLPTIPPSPPALPQTMPVPEPSGRPLSPDLPITFAEKIPLNADPPAVSHLSHFNLPTVIPPPASTVPDSLSPDKISLWPDLPQDALSAAAQEPEAMMTHTRRREDLDREQRGILWNESPF